MNTYEFKWFKNIVKLQLPNVHFFCSAGYTYTGLHWYSPSAIIASKHIFGSTRKCNNSVLGYYYKLNLL